MQQLSPTLMVLVIAAIAVLFVLRPLRGPDQPLADDGTRELQPVDARPAEIAGVAGPARGRRWEVRALGGPGFVLGRAADCSVMVGGETATRRHATITMDSGHWRLHDMNSANGTYLNGQRVSSAALADGDVITIGDSQLLFRAQPGQPFQVPATVPVPAQPPPPQPPPAGLLIPGFEAYAMSQIDKGTTAIVLKGVPMGGGEPVAVKVLTNADPFFREKFGQEAYLLKHLRHPHIVNELASGLAAGNIPYIVMEYCAHGSLHHHLTGRPLPEDFVRLVGIQTCAALDYAHRFGVVHRDVKPANLLFAGPQHVKVGDFGISRWTQTRSITVHGTVLGTVTYMAPEQARGDVVGPQGDIYSLGVVLYQMLAGRPPFAGEPTDVMAHHVRTAPAPLLHTAPDLARAVMQALAKEPARRHASATAFAQALGGAPPAPTPAPARAGLRLLRMAPQGMGDIILSTEVTELGRTMLDPNDQQVSRRHARLLLKGGVCWVEDPGSANGTWVNHQRVVGQMPLRPGDQLRIGNSVFRLEAR